MKNINTKARKENVVKPESPIEGLSWKIYQLTQERKLELLKAFALWIELEDSLQLEWFYRSQKITEELWKSLCEKEERFRVLDRNGRMVIGARREKKMWDFKMSTQVALPTQHYYSSDFKRAYDEKIALQKELAAKQKAEPVEVTIKYIPDTGVPHRKLESEPLNKIDDLNEI